MIGGVGDRIGAIVVGCDGCGLEDNKNLKNRPKKRVRKSVFETAR